MNQQKDNIFYQLISRRDFVDWVNDPNRENNGFWQTWADEHPDCAQEFWKAREFVQRLHFQRYELQDGEMDAILRKVVAADQGTGHQMDSQPRFHIGQWLKVAAILTFCLLMALLGGEVLKRTPEISPTALEWKSAVNPRGQKSMLTLSDGTIVHLNYDSKLRFPEKFQGAKREVELEGEAFFEVAHDAAHPFIVKTGEMSTEVLGTSFNVQARKYASATSVSLVSGKVKVSIDKQPDHFLRPGEQLDFDESTQKVAVGTFDPSILTAWKDGAIVFIDTEFDAFIDRLSNWYGVDFQIYGDTPKNWKVNGRYENEKLEDILTGMQFMYNIKYKIDGKNVTLKFE